ncbi:MAG: MFS transporter, partial [Chloroflexota bacterium]
MGGQPRIGLWRHRNFLKLWTGQSVSQLGSQITLLALPLTAALLLNASPLEMGFLSAVEMAPFLLIGLPAGVWVDRWPRRPVLIAGDVGRAVVLVTVPVGYLVGLLTMAQLYVVAFISGILTVFFDVAYMSYLPSLVERDQLIEGNSKMETTRAAAEVAGPGLAGTLVDLLSAPLAIAFDALSFIVSAIFVWNIRTDESAALGARAGKRNGLWVEVGEGLRYVAMHPLLRSIAGCTATSNLFSSAFGPIYILFAVRELGLEPATIGFIFAVGNVGFLVGASLASRVADRLGLGPA